MSIELKIKAKHLALEPQVIRHEEDKLKKQMTYHRGEEGSYWEFQRKLQDLMAHRRWNVRNESRATTLARAYLAGKVYSTIEKRHMCNDVMFQIYILPRIVTMVSKYGKGDQRKVTKDIIYTWSKM
jgi:hypothetical protein